MGRLYIVGSGPGDIRHLTEAARQAIAVSDTIVGYTSYIDLIRPLVAGKRVVSTAMMQEVERCREAIRLAREGETVALISGGDAGIYGMAGLVLELIEIDLQQDGQHTCSRDIGHPGHIGHPGSRFPARRPPDARLCRHLALRPADPLGPDQDHAWKPPPGRIS